MWAVAAYDSRLCGNRSATNVEASLAAGQTRFGVSCVSPSSELPRGFKHCADHWGLPKMSHVPPSPIPKLVHLFWGVAKGYTQSIEYCAH